MSRSYKKHPIATDHNAKVTKQRKRAASKKIRKVKDVPGGKSYRKFYDPWNICDYKIRTTWKEELHSVESKLGRRLTKDEKVHLKNYWEKFYKRK